MQGGDQIITVNEADVDLMDLPPGFRFHPTDEEIITHYLERKATDSRFTALAIAEVDMNKCEPWDLPKKGKGGEKENYFFCQRDRKYPTGMRTNRATESGYWKATGKDKEIYKPKNCLVGMKKTLVFYKGRAPKGEKTNWVMHEYRLEGRYCYYNFPKGPKDEWVVCRVFHKKETGLGRSPTLGDVWRIDSFLNHDDDHHHRLPPLIDLQTGQEQHANRGIFMDNIYNHGFQEEAGCSNPVSNQSYPFSGFEATPPATISAAIPASNEPPQYFKVEPASFSNATVSQDDDELDLESLWNY